MKTELQKTKQMPHLGNLVNNLIDEKRHTRVSLGKLIGKSGNTVYGYSLEPSLQARILWDLSTALDYDFFEYLSNSLNLNNKTDSASKNAQSMISKTEQIAQMEQRIKELEKEVTIYKDILKK